MKTIVNNIYSLSDYGLLKQLGSKIKEIRLARNITQSRLQQLSGVHRTIISDIENGKNTGILTIIQLLRALEALNLLELFLEQPEISPLALAKLHGKKRRRASSKENKNQKGESEW